LEFFEEVLEFFLGYHSWLMDFELFNDVSVPRNDLFHYFKKSKLRFSYRKMSEKLKNVHFEGVRVQKCEFLVLKCRFLLDFSSFFTFKRLKLNLPAGTHINFLIVFDSAGSKLYKKV